MKMLRYFGCLTFLGLLVMLDGCASFRGGGGRAMNADVTLVSFGSVQGELAPCG